MRFPVQLHPFHRFVDNGQHFICDLNTGILVEIDTVLWQMLELCETLSRPGLVNRLAGEFPEHRIFAAMERFEQLAQAGILVASERASSIPQQAARLRVLVLHDLLSPGSDKAILQEVQRHAALLPALGQAVELILPMPSTFHRAFQCLSSHVTLREWNPRELYQELRHLHGTYDLILDLACTSGYLLPLYHAETPPIVTLHAEHGIPSTNLVLATAAVMRPFDAMILGSSWQAKWVQEYLPGSAPLATASSGIVSPGNTDSGKQQARDQILQFVGKDIWKGRPIVGLYLDGQTGNVLRAAFSLAAAEPTVNFLLLATSRPTTTRSYPENLYCVGVHSSVESPTWWQALDLLCVAPGWRTVLSYVMVAMTYETPLVVCSEEMPVEFQQAAHWIEYDEDEGLIAKQEAFLDMAQQILASPHQRREMAERARVRAAEFTVGKWVSELVEVFERSVQQHKVAHTNDDTKVELPILFCRTYDPATGCDRTESVILSDGSRLPFNEALLEALAPECTPTELAMLRDFLAEKARIAERPR